MLQLYPCGVPVTRRLLALAFLLVILLILSAERGIAGSSGHDVLGTATLRFPTAALAEIQNATRLAIHLTQKLQIPPINENLTIVNDVAGLFCCMSDWSGRRIAVTNERDILYTVNDSVHLTLDYSEAGRLISAVVLGPFGPVLPTADVPTMIQRLDGIMTSLGINSSGDLSIRKDRGSVLINGTTLFVPTMTVVKFENYSGNPVAFGNELRMTFDLEHRVAIEFVVFPWFSATPPTLTAEMAFTYGLDSLNSTVNSSGAVFSEGSVYLAFDFIHYSLTYQIEAVYVARSGVSGASGDYRVWVDPYNGNITYTVRILPHGGGPGAFILGTYLPYLIAVTGAVILSISVLVFEPIQVAFFSLLIPLYTRLDRGRALDHFVRGQLFGYIASHPGVSYSEIRDAFSLTNGTTTYHLSVLQALGFVGSTNQGTHKLFFARGSDSKRLGRRLSGLQFRILNTLKELGSASPSEIAQSISISRQRAGYNLKRMAESGLILADHDEPGQYRIVNDGESELADVAPTSQ